MKANNKIGQFLILKSLNLFHLVWSLESFTMTQRTKQVILDAYQIINSIYMNKPKREKTSEKFRKQKLKEKRHYFFAVFFFCFRH